MSYPLGAKPLDTGDVFPHLFLKTTDGREIELAGTGRWTIFTVYRGDWCPFCHEHLNDLARAHDTFAALDVEVIVASVDTFEDALKTIDAERIAFRVGYGLDTRATAGVLGSFYSDTADGSYLQPADFIIRPDGVIESSTYSSSAVGRLSAADALGLIRFRKKQHTKAEAVAST